MMPEPLEPLLWQRRVDDAGGSSGMLPCHGRQALSSKLDRESPIDKMIIL
jgi:hypothetical protein